MQGHHNPDYRDLLAEMRSKSGPISEVLAGHLSQKTAPKSIGPINQTRINLTKITRNLRNGAKHVL